MNPTEHWLPVFPLDLALLPGAFLPLHIFEPRYRALTRRCLEANQPFGVVRIHDGNLARIGCAARIVQVLETLPDGRSNILVRGEERFTLLDLREHADGYLEAKVGAVYDDPAATPDPQDRQLLDRLLRTCAELVGEGGLPGEVVGMEDAERALSEIRAVLDADSDSDADAETDLPSEEEPDLEETAPEEASQAGIRPGLPPDLDPTPVEGSGAGADSRQQSFALAARVPLGVDERQALLETFSERERTEALLGHLARLVPRLRAHEKDRRKVRGNGKPIPPEA